MTDQAVHLPGRHGAGSTYKLQGKQNKCGVLLARHTGRMLQYCSALATREFRNTLAWSSRSSLSSGCAARCGGGAPAPRRAPGTVSYTHLDVYKRQHLNHPAFRELLRQAEEEYGFPSGSGPVALPCDEEHFRDVLRRVSSDERHHLVRAHTLVFCGPAAARGVTKRRAEPSSRAPLLQGMAVDSLVW
ncbi:hypothetical protein E2562_005069 [Oryza meyeriana var. granulata]|uniref:Auxin-responsive protein n=1 Tax=Oryza meyeriana var. granulata TaxID=110450 RepID=A0A6G1BRD1_9ORYZ|nr:hypothetical protein E2562_005069 [Oryza meyeriana var. granulata]